MTIVPVVCHRRAYSWRGLLPINEESLYVVSPNHATCFPGRKSRYLKDRTAVVFDTRHHLGTLIAVAYARPRGWHLRLALRVHCCDGMARVQKLIGHVGQ